MSNEPVTLNSVFRCTQFACLLTVKACLRRQGEVWRKPGKTSNGKRFVVEKPMHPHCAGGTCEQGNAHRAALPNHVPEQPADHRSAPRLDLVNQETTMPRGKPTTKRTCCDSHGTRHLASCPTQGKPGPRAVAAIPTAIAKAAQRRAKPATGAVVFERTDYGYLADETIDELVNALATIDRTRAAVVAEIRHRRDAIDQALKGLDQPAAAEERAVG